jgi:hypothetical protein
MGLIRRFAHWLEVARVERQMRRRYKARPDDYARTRQWFNVGRDVAPADAYEQLLQFVRQTVALSPRPYGEGAYGLVLAAIWQGAGKDDRWETTFTYAERQAVYEQVTSKMANWSPPPLAMMVGVLPYGALAPAAD